ncbi:hypothetical protein MRX96_043616 [Rhipicephalus microplus]
MRDQTMPTKRAFVALFRDKRKLHKKTRARMFCRECLHFHGRAGALIAAAIRVSSGSLSTLLRPPLRIFSPAADDKTRQPHRTRKWQVGEWKAAVSRARLGPPVFRERPEASPGSIMEVVGALEAGAKVAHRCTSAPAPYKRPGSSVREVHVSVRVLAYALVCVLSVIAYTSVFFAGPILVP